MDCYHSTLQRDIHVMMTDTPGMYDKYVMYSNVHVVRLCDQNRENLMYAT